MILKVSLSLKNIFSFLFATTSFSNNEIKNKKKKTRKKKEKNKKKKDVKYHGTLGPPRVGTLKCRPHFGLYLEKRGNKAERGFKVDDALQLLKTWPAESLEKEGNGRMKHNLGDSPSFLHSCQRPQWHTVMGKGTSTNHPSKPALWAQAGKEDGVPVCQAGLVWLMNLKLPRFGESRWPCTKFSARVLDQDG